MTDLARSVPRVFNAMKGHRPLLKRMNLGHLAMDFGNSELSSAANDFMTLILRYSPELDYADFSTELEFIRTMRRFETVKYASELESLTLRLIEMERKAEQGGGGNVDNVYLEARIHDKVREAVEQSALGGDSAGNLSRMQAVDSTSIVAYYHKTLSLMQD